MNKKVYFAGSIRGGRSDGELYKKIIEYIKQTDTVLTEHVGDLSLSLYEGSLSYEKQIYDQDTAWLRECDLVIAECTVPSLGVGYELAYAEKLGKPCHVLYRPREGSLSAMIKGDDYYLIHPYVGFDEAKEIIDQILK